MNPLRTLPPLAVLLLAGLAQSQEQEAHFTILVQNAIGDVVLNQPLVAAILGEPACHDELRRALGGPLTSVRGIAVDMPTAHLAATYQIHVYVDVDYKAAWTQEVQNLTMDVVVAHLQKQLDALFYREPQAHLAARRNELNARHGELQAKRSHLLAQIESQQAALDQCRQRRLGIDVQVAAVQLELATEQHALTHLHKLRSEHTLLRDRLRQQSLELQLEHVATEARMADLSTQLLSLRSRGNEVGAREEVAKLGALLEQHGKQVRSSATSRQTAESELADTQRMLSVVLEQVPINALALQRVQARSAALDEQRKAVTDDLARCDHKQVEMAQVQAESEQIGIDISVSKTLLIEVVGKLTRLQPPQYRVLRGRQ